MGPAPRPSSNRHLLRRTRRSPINNTRPAPPSLPTPSYLLEIPWASRPWEVGPTTLPGPPTLSHPARARGELCRASNLMGGQSWLPYVNHGGPRACVCVCVCGVYLVNPTTGGLVAQHLQFVLLVGVGCHSEFDKLLLYSFVSFNVYNIVIAAITIWFSVVQSNYHCPTLIVFCNHWAATREGVM